MSQAVIAYIYLKKANLLDKFDMNYLLTSIIMTNMDIHYEKEEEVNKPRVVYKNTENKTINLVHYADIINMAAYDKRLVV